MGTDEKLASIIADPAFEAVARAVREATVTAQNRKARNQEPWREIRYELLHDLHRTKKGPGRCFRGVRVRVHFAIQLRECTSPGDEEGLAGGTAERERRATSGTLPEHRRNCSVDDPLVDRRGGH